MICLKKSTSPNHLDSPGPLLLDLHCTPIDNYETALKRIEKRCRCEELEDVQEALAAERVRSSQLQAEFDAANTAYGPFL